MALQLVPFGTLADGRPVRLARIERGAIVLEVTEYGAAVRSLRVGGVETVLGFGSLDSYVADQSYQGVIVGRVANRIAAAAFEIDGERYQVTANEGTNCLHGGRLGFDKRLWRFAEISDERVTLVYASDDGEEGFPGALDVEVSFRLVDDGLLLARVRARRPLLLPAEDGHRAARGGLRDAAGDERDAA